MPIHATLDETGKVPTAQLPDMGGGGPHTHPISDVTNLQATLDGKATTSHSHAISDVTSLQTGLDGKAASSHTHTKANITDFAHTHTISDTTGLQTALDGKSDVGHTHPGGSGAVITAKTITAPYNVYEYSETFSEANVTTGSNLIVGLGKTTDDDENDLSMNTFAVSYRIPSNGNLTLTVSSDEPFGGPIKLTYLIGS